MPASPLDALSDAYLGEVRRLDPSLAVFLGLGDVANRLTEFTPEAVAERVEAGRAFAEAAAAAPLTSERDRIAKDTIAERIGVQLDQYEAGEWQREVSVISSPPQVTRRVFDLAPTSSEADWERIAELLDQVPSVLAGHRASLLLGAASGHLATRRLALASAVQMETTAEGYFRRFAAGAPGGADDRLERAAAAADAAYGELAEFLRRDYAPLAEERDGVGRERYALASRQWNGLELDLEDTYAWGFEELARIEDEMALVAEEIAPGEGVAGAVAILETDPERSIAGLEPLIDWLQQLMDSTIEDLQGVHFEIPEPVRRVEACIAPPGSAAALYYTPPSADFSRPGRTWYPDPGRERHPLWVEVATAYHEGVPGHHLQFGYTAWLGERLNSFQRSLAFVSGHIEGWALYAERLMGELGYLDDPDYRLGMLANQAMRAARVVVDIGLHLGLALPANQRYHPGETWSAELAVPFMVAAGRRPQAFMRSEVDRYLGLPGQAIGYKVGERVWLSTRQQVRRNEGASFDLKRFHERAFELGFVGLGQLEAELTR